MTFSDEVLNQLVPAIAWKPDWANALERAGELNQHWWQSRARRRLILALATLAAVFIPLVALAAENDWWFFKYGGAPAPTSPPVVVKEGNWDGRAWELVAYPTVEGVCFSVMLPGAQVRGDGAAMSCGLFAGVARTNGGKASGTKITFMMGSSEQLPAYIAGPVIDNASRVEIRFANGQLLRVPTFAAPTSVGRVRFYAIPLPTGVTLPRPGSGPVEVFKSIAGLDDDGNVIACLAPASTATGMTSSLSACT